MGCHFPLQGIFPTQGSNPGFLHCRKILYHLSHQDPQKYISRRSHCELEELAFKGGLAPTSLQLGRHCKSIQPVYLSFRLPWSSKLYKVTWPSWSPSSGTDMMQSDSPVSRCQARAWTEAARLLLGWGGVGGQLRVSLLSAWGKQGPRSCKVLSDRKAEE